MTHLWKFPGEAPQPCLIILQKPFFSPLHQYCWRSVVLSFIGEHGYHCAEPLGICESRLRRGPFDEISARTCWRVDRRFNRLPQTLSCVGYTHRTNQLPIFRCAILYLEWGSHRSTAKNSLSRTRPATVCPRVSVSHRHSAGSHHSVVMNRGAEVTFHQSSAIFWSLCCCPSLGLFYYTWEAGTLQHC